MDVQFTPQSCLQGLMAVGQRAHPPKSIDFPRTPVLESGQDNGLTSDHDNRWESCDWMDVLSTGGLFSSVPDRRSVPAYL
jgi:hypothetical protein